MQQAPFATGLTSVFESCVSLDSENRGARVFNWDELFFKLEESAQCFTEPAEIGCTCDLLLDSLLEYGCGDDLKAFSRIAQMYYAWCRVNRAERGTRFARMKDKLEYCVATPLFTRSEVIQLQTVNFKFRESAFRIALDLRDPKWTAVLTRHAMIARDFHSTLRRFLPPLIKYVFREYNQSPGEGVFDAAFRDLSDLEATNGWMQGENERGIIRVVLILDVLRAVQLSRARDPLAHRLVECLRIYFRIIADPFVSKEEVHEFLLFTFRRHPFKEEVAKNLSEEYDVLFNGHRQSVLPYTPRSLKHLGRCAVRDVLTQKLTLLPKSVGKLGLPRTLEEYVLGAI